MMVALFFAGMALGEPPSTPETRALAFLMREVPSWPEENRCYSCHNSGVAVSALYQALGHKRFVAAETLTTTTAFLKTPGTWDYRPGEATPFDRALVRIQFAAALAQGYAVGLIHDKGPLREAGRLVAKEQDRDGSWKVVAPGTLGSPATLGDPLATWMASRVLQAAEAEAHAESLRRAGRWFRQGVPLDHVPAAAALLLALREDQDAEAKKRRHEAVTFLLNTQDREGGWGPTARDSTEPFDTALALLALLNLTDTSEVRERVRRGRRSLVAAQEEDGAWPATTRPARAVSYAQRCATAGWATQALLATASWAE